MDRLKTSKDDLNLTWTFKELFKIVLATYVCPLQLSTQEIAL